MAILDFLTGGQRQPMGGVVGQLAQAGYTGAPQRRPMGITQDPDFANSLVRLGANLMQAGAQSDDVLGNIGTALGATMEQNQARRLQDAQIQAIQAKAPTGPSGPFSGQGYQNQIMASRYQFHIASGDDPLTAQQKAINDFYSLNPVTGVDAEGRPIVSPRASLPFQIGQQGGAPMQPAMQAPAAMPQAQQMDAIDQTAAALGFPSGTLLPPPVAGADGMPSGGGAPMPMGQAPQVGRGPMIETPQAPGPKTAQALAEEAGRAEIGVQERFAEQLADIEANRLKGIREASSEMNRMAPDMERLALAIQNYGSTGSFGDLRLGINKIASEFGVANPERVAEGEIVKQIVSKMTPQMRPPGSGAASDADMRLFMDSLPNLFTTPEGAARGFQYFQRVRDYQSRLAQEAENYAYNNRTMRGFSEYVKGLEENGQLSLWNEEERKQLDAIARGVVPGQAGMPQPRTREDFEKLPSGTQFLDPNGVLRRKP